RSVNQRLPSGPVVMPLGVPFGSAPVGIVNSVTVPVVLIRPIFPPKIGWLVVGSKTGGWLLGRSVVGLLAFISVNQSAPSGTAVIELGLKPVVGKRNSVTTPLVVMRPIWKPFTSVNQRLPSEPTTMLRGELPGVGIANSATTPLGVIRPILSAFASVNQRLPSGPATIPEGALPAVGNANVLSVDGTHLSSKASRQGRKRWGFCWPILFRRRDETIGC